jgi:drug/metabolite transporter (DMT)-like permease
VTLAGVFWSTIGLGIRMIEQANVWQILLYRSFSLAAFLFCLISLRSNFKPLEPIRRAGRAGVIGAFGLVVAFSGGIYAIQTTTVANAMFLFASAPFLAAGLGWFILNERVGKMTVLSMLVALAGISLMVRQGFSSGHAIGNMCALLSALGFAIFSISLRWGKLEDMLPSVFLAGLFAMVVAAIVCYVNGYSFIVPARDITIALSMGVFQVGAGLAVYTIGSKVVPAAELTLLSMTEVLLGPLWVWLFIGETVSTNILFGGVILMLAIAGNATVGIRDYRYRSL